MSRTILHIDMNNFYASVECQRNPELRGHPVAVCGSEEERHGIVLAKNYQAKAYGVSTGEVIWKAKEKCKNLVIVPPHYDDYMKVSKAAREIYSRYTDLIEPFGMDEVWADVTGSLRCMGGAETIAEEIRKTITRELGLTVSIGVSFNKVFAKLGSDMKKPDAITYIPKETFREKVWDLPASDMLGVGSKTYEKLTSVGIRTIGQLARFPVDFFKNRLGVVGVDLWKFANGLDNSPVTVRDTEAPEKSCGHGITTLQDLENSAEVWKVMLELAQEIGHRLYIYNKKATGVAIYIRDNTLITMQKQCSIPLATQSASIIAREAFSLFERTYHWHKPIRSVTIRAFNLVSMDQPEQMSLFVDNEARCKAEALDKCVDALRSRYGNTIIRNACLLDNPKMSTYEHKVIMPTGVPR